MKTQAANKKRQATTGKQLPPQAGGSRSQRILQEALLENETMLACLVRKSPVGMFVLRNGKFIQVSETLADIFGYDRKEILQLEAFADLAAISSREKLQKLLSKTGRSNQDL